jgi:hypothetical protein
LRVSGRSKADFNYFKQLSQLRSIDTDNGAQVELRLGRLMPHAGGEWVNARDRNNLEIDYPVRRLDSSWNGGIDLQLSGKTSIGVLTRWSRQNYEGETAYNAIDFGRYLDGTTMINGVTFRYSLTPFTTVGVSADKDHSDFPQAPERNSDGGRLTSVVEFQPLALVSGRFEIGYRRRTFVDGKEPPFEGVVGRADLGYTLLGRTRFAVGWQRDLSSSYRPDQRDYLQTGVELSVTHRLANAWDVEGKLGRFRLIYRLADASGTEAENVRSYGFDVGYRIEKTRVGFQVIRQTRASDFSGQREYEEMRMISSLSYGF